MAKKARKDGGLRSWRMFTDRCSSSNQGAYVKFTRIAGGKSVSDGREVGRKTTYMIVHCNNIFTTTTERHRLPIVRQPRYNISSYSLIPGIYHLWLYSLLKPHPTSGGVHYPIHRCTFVGMANGRTKLKSASNRERRGSHYSLWCGGKCKHVSVRLVHFTGMNAAK